MKQPCTSCKDCGLAVYDGNTQTDCRLGRLDRFRSLDPESVVEAYDEEKNFFVISGRTCAAHTQEADPARVRKALTVRWAAVVPFRESHLEAALATGRSLGDGKLPPHHVHFVSSRLRRPQDVHEKFFAGLGNTLTWRIVQLTGKRTGVHQKVDVAVRGLPRGISYYGVFWPGCRVPADYGSTLDRLVNEELRSVGLIRPRRPLAEGGNGLTVHLNLFNSAVVSGHRVVTHEGRKVRDPSEKLTEALEKHVLTVEELWPDL